MPYAADILRVLRVLADREDLGVPFQRHVARMDVERAEAAAEGLVLLLRHLLVAEEYDLVLDEGPPDLIEGGVVHRSRQVDPVHLRPAGADRKSTRLNSSH